MMHHPGLFIQHTEEKGRGVFTHLDIEKDDVIEICPVIIFSSQDKVAIHKTGLHDYYFLWGVDFEQGAIALGFGSIYNHSSDPNARFEYDFSNETISIISLRDIAADEEITMNYITDKNQGATLWFEEK